MGSIRGFPPSAPACGACPAPASARLGGEVRRPPRRARAGRRALLALLAAAACERSDLAGPEAEMNYGPDATRTYQEGSILYLERVHAGRRARVGLEERWGGSIVEVSLGSQNFVNAFDAGREIQLSLYDGAHRYDDCAACEGIWGWNPVQGGDRHRNGSVILEKRLEEGSLYVRVQPNHWFPENKGGGGGHPVRGDVVFEQWVSALPEHPTAFRLRYRITHLGSDTHAFTEQQEFPAIYVNREYDRFVHYAGFSPWTRQPATTSAIPRLFVDPRKRLHTAEWWGAFVNERNIGITLFTPGSYPYMTSGVQPGSTGPKGTGAVYTHPFTPFGIAPGAVIEGDVYLMVGDYRDARETVYDLVRSVEVIDVAAPIGGLNPRAEEMTGVVELDGWAHDNAALAAVEVRVDGKLAGRASLGRFRPDVRQAWPDAPSTAGFLYRLDTTRYDDGEHTVTARLVDAAGNQNELSVEATFRNANP